MILILAPGSGLAHGPWITGPSATVNAYSQGAANAPWSIVEVHTSGDLGQYASVAIDPLNGTPCTSYYDATSHDLRKVHHVGHGGNCGPDNAWPCKTADSGGDVGKHSSIAIYPGWPSGAGPWGMGIAYHDATNGSLKYAATQDSGSGLWAIHSIDRGILAVSTTGFYPTLKLRSRGYPAIAHHFNNPTNVDPLKFTYDSVASGNCESGDLPDSWRCETIITGEGVG
ncbi:MAG: hypothetical protein PVH41_08280 [Anaerolineae bacterium]